MKDNRSTFLLGLLVLITFAFNVPNLSAQSKADTASYPYWIQMMQDPNANFFETQKAFNTYWQDRTVTRGSGWKPFKRWEYFMHTRVNPDGSQQSPDHVQKAYNEYIQRKDQSTSLAGNWSSQGPFVLPSDKGYKGLGRINAIGFHPTDPNIVYIGAPAGGLWVTTVGGNSWSTTTDMLPTLGVSAVVVDPVNPSIIYIGTGDRDAGDAPGVGVMKSTDSGQTWSSANTGMGNVIISKMLIDPNNNSVIYAASTSGMYKSTDGAATWTRKAIGGFKDLVFKPNNPSILYAAQGGLFFRSLDAGETWNQVSNGIAPGTRGVLAVSPAAPEMVYFLLAQGDNGFRGLYRSTDGGSTFTERSDSPNIMDWSCEGSGSGGQAWYDLALAADPVNPDIIYAGGVNVWKSTNGGANWQINGHWYGGCSVPAVHADQHFFGYNPINNRLYIGNDGGIYWTDNGGNNWVEITNGLAISQAYKLGQSATEDDLVVNGYQDNGTSILEGTEWSAIGGGDGMECAIDFTDPMYRYTTVYYGSIQRVYGFQGQGTIAANGVNGIDEEGAWVTPFILDANDPNSMFIGYKNVWRSDNIKAANVGSVKWKRISAINTPNLEVLEQSPVNTDILYASNAGNLYICTNAHAEFTSWLSISGNLPGAGAITAIEAHPFEENTVYIVQNRHVYKSQDKGTTWTDLTGGLPDIPISSIVYYKQSQEGLYIGTDAGVFYRENGMTDWIPFTNGMPANVRVTELEIYYDPSGPAGDRIKAATYGRGMWKSDMYGDTPTVNFTADPLLIPFGCTVNFKDLSSGVPTNWLWTFPGGQPSTSTEKNPSGILYAAPGVYDVQLIAGNSVGSDTTIKSAYVVVSDTIQPIAGFSASPRIFCNINQTVNFTDTSNYCPYAWQWSITPSTFSFVNGTAADSQHPQVKFEENGSYNVSLTILNSNGMSSITKEDYIVVGGYLLPFAEDFESGNFVTKGWTIENPDNLVTWDIAEVGGNTPGNQAARMNFFEYSVPPGRRDRLISPVMNFSATSPVFLTFEHAYSTRYTSFSDSLIILVSEDCGISWERVFAAGEKGQGTFATVPKMTVAFTPSTPEDWCGGGWGSACYLVDLTHYANKQGIQLAFETYNRFGNNLYIDNIAISRTTNLFEKPGIDNAIVIYPNPSNGIVTLSSQRQVEDLKLQIFNTLGKAVMSKELPSGSALNEVVDISAFPKGIYLFSISEKNGVQQSKVVLQ